MAKNRSKKKTQLVPKQRTKQRKQVAISDSAATAAYRAALMNPFSSVAQGARVPDMYAAPTVPKHFSGSYTLSTSGSSGQLIVLPNLYMPLIVPTGAITGGSTWVTMDGVTGSPQCVILPTTTLSDQLTNYRIVGYGVRLYCTGAVTSTQGRVMVATNPVSSWVNDKNAKIGGQATTSNNTSASKDATLQAYGIPTGGNGLVSSSSLPSMQNCIEVSLVSLASNPITITPKINSPEAFEFRQTRDSSIGFGINNQTSASYVSSGDPSYLRVAGHELVVIVVEGAAGAGPVLQVEVIYHVEGAPSASPLSGDAPAVVANPTTMAETIAAAARTEPFKMGLEAAGNMAIPGLGTFVKGLL